MLDEKEIDIEIARLEYGESSYPAYQKLANLYIIKNQLHKVEENQLPAYDYGYSRAAGSEDSTLVGDYGDSEFLMSVSGKDSEKAWAVMDELMDTLRVVNPKVYNRILQKIIAL